MGHKGQTATQVISVGNSLFGERVLSNTNIHGRDIILKLIHIKMLINYWSNLFSLEVVDASLKMCPENSGGKCVERRSGDHRS